MPLALGIALAEPDPARRLEQMREAERLGAESLWLEPRPGEDALAALAELARATSRLRLATWGHALEARHPLVSARAVAELDRLSGGRVELGLRDVDSASLAEAILVCKKLWCDPTVEHRGASFALDETALGERPLQRPWPRLHLAGESDAALERAARLTDGWLGVGHSPASIAAPLARIRAERVRAETLDGRFQISVRAEPEDRAELDAWQGAGVDRLIVSFATLRRLLASGADILGA
jgi:alkanesulfonate monooxygenase SsuD/methylene tetrahydromethanopterin reductase-like flavin-dependent oxidoreductase (luciferase family)